MDWKELAISLSKEGKNSGEITRELQSLGFFSGEDFGKCYDRVRKYVRKVKQSHPIWQNVIPNIINAQKKETEITFGLIGDTHIGNKCTQLSHLKEFYNLCKKSGADTVYHCGDITDGYKMRDSQEYELYVHGVDEIIDSVIKSYPKVSGITTKFITGNHDASIYKTNGTDIGKYISRARNDLEYLGRDCAIVNLSKNCSMYLCHPWDGSSYAISQKSQKLIDGMDDKPNIVAIGHYHKAEYMFYRNVHSFQVGCFESKTPFEIGKNIPISVGGWIVKIKFDKDGNIITLSPTFVPFSKNTQNDFANFTKT